MTASDLVFQKTARLRDVDLERGYEVRPGGWGRAFYPVHGVSGDFSNPNCATCGEPNATHKQFDGKTYCRFLCEFECEQCRGKTSSGNRKYLAYNVDMGHELHTREDDVIESSRIVKSIRKFLLIVSLFLH